MTSHVESSLAVALPPQRRRRASGPHLVEPADPDGHARDHPRGLRLARRPPPGRRRRPGARPGEVLVRIRAAAANPWDWHFMRGLPYIARLNGAGIRRPKHPVLGGRHRRRGRRERSMARLASQVGDAVYGFIEFDGFAEYAAVRESGARADAGEPSPSSRRRPSRLRPRRRSRVSATRGRSRPATGSSSSAPPVGSGPSPSSSPGGSVPTSPA